jgi:putative tricarboxylic transport membrane protein
MPPDPPHPEARSPGDSAHRHRSERLAGVCLALAAAAVAAEAATFRVAFLTDPVGPRALPWLAAIILGAAGTTMALRPGPSPAWPTPRVMVRLGGAVAVFLAYGIVLPSLGFVTSTTAAVAALSMLFGGPPLKSVLAALVLSACIWLLFVQVLALPLPLGTLWILEPR